MTHMDYREISPIGWDGTKAGLLWGARYGCAVEFHTKSLVAAASDVCGLRSTG